MRGLFFFRLVPPRADFAQTMTPTEQDAMAQHQAYWQDLLDGGRALVYGPVADPEGVWGLGVIRAHDRLEALELAENDPAVAAGISTFELLEIMGGSTG